MTDSQNALSTMTDEEVMVLYQNGSNSAFSQIYSRYSAKVYTYLLGKRLSTAESEDLTQEIFVKLHRSRHLYDSSLKLAPWIFTISRSIYLDFLRKNQARDNHTRSIEIFDHIAPNPTGTQNNENPLSLQIPAYSSLPEKYKNVVEMRLIDELEFEQIANRLGTNASHVRQLFHRAIKKLRSLMAKQESV